MQLDTSQIRHAEGLQMRIQIDQDNPGNYVGVSVVGRTIALNDLPIGFLLMGRTIDVLFEGVQ